MNCLKVQARYGSSLPFQALRTILLKATTSQKPPCPPNELVKSDFQQILFVFLQINLKLHFVWNCDKTGSPVPIGF